MDPRLLPRETEPLRECVGLLLHENGVLGTCRFEEELLKGLWGSFPNLALFCVVRTLFIFDILTLNGRLHQVTRLNSLKLRSQPSWGRSKKLFGDEILRI